MTGFAPSFCALVFNVAVSALFVIVPCEILRLGAGSFEVGLSAALHSISYVALTVVNGRLAVRRKTQLAMVRWSCVALAILLGSGLLGFASRSGVRAAAVAFMGLGCGLANFTAIYLSILWAQAVGRNLSGYAEGVLGAGILSGSLLGGVLVGRSVQSQFMVAVLLNSVFVCLLLRLRRARTEHPKIRIHGV